MITPRDIAVAKVSLGARLAALRQAAGHNQQALARLLFTSRSSIANIERGRQLGTRDLWQRCDDLLRADGALIGGYDELRGLVARQYRDAAAAITANRGTPADGTTIGGEGSDAPQDETPAGRSSTVVAVFDGLRAALATYRPVVGPVVGACQLSAVEAAAAGLHGAYQRANYGKAASMLPALVHDAHGWVLATVGDRRERALRVQSSVYIAASKLAGKAGDGHLAWLAADRAAVAAQLCGATALAAVAAYQAACALLRVPGRAAEAETIAATAIEDIDPAAAASDADLLSARGSLLLLAALIAARRTDAPTARSYLNKAASAAEQLGRDGNHLWTGFGPTNVAIHKVSTAVALGQPDKAIRIGETLDTSRLPAPLLGRRTQVHLDLAAASALRPDGDAVAVLHLLEAERVAPQAVHVNAAARALLTTMVARERRTVTPGLRPLAERAGIAA